MHPDAELGDIGRGKPLDRDEQHDVVRLVEKRHNPRVSTALVLGMMDAEKATLRAKVQILSAGKETTEYRVVTKDELERLRQTKMAILDVQTIKEAGDAGTYSGSKARSLGVLAVQTADSRGEIAQLYNLPREALREDPASGDKPQAQMIKVDGKIEPVLEAFIERQIDRAVAGGVNTIIFHIDSAGGPLRPESKPRQRHCRPRSEKSPHDRLHPQGSAGQRGGDCAGLRRDLPAARRAAGRCPTDGRRFRSGARARFGRHRAAL